MRIAEKVARLECAEDLFEILGVEFDPRVLAVRRLSILKRFGILIADIQPDPAVPLDEEDCRRRYRDALLAAYTKHAEMAAAMPSPIVTARDALVTLRRKLPSDA